MTRDRASCFFLFVVAGVAFAFLGVASEPTHFLPAARFSDARKNKGAQAPTVAKAMAGKQPASKAWKNSHGSFQCLEEEDALELTYIWKWYYKPEQRLCLKFSKTVLERAVAANGMMPHQRSEFFAEALSDADGVTSDILNAVREQRGPVHLPEYGVLSSKVRNDFFQWLEKTETAFLASRNFERARKGRLTIDYSGFVRAHMPSVKPIADELIRMGVERELTWLWLKHGWMALVHNMEYELPPTLEDGRFINGIWSPLGSFCRGRGDCDTKAALFSVVVNHFSDTRCAIVVIPGHAFNGMVGWHKRMPTDTIFKHRGVDMVLLDLTDQSTYNSCGKIHSADQQSLREQKPEVYETW